MRDCASVDSVGANVHPIAAPPAAEIPAKRVESKPELRGFDEFWAAYPKKRSRGDAEKAWQKLRPDKALLAKILEAVEVAKTGDDWRKDNGQFIPYPASWLRSKGWEDEHGTPATAGVVSLFEVAL